MNGPDWDAVVGKLAVDTESGALVWSASPQRVRTTIDRGEIVGPIYTCSVLDKTVVAYRYQSKYYTDEEEYRLFDHVGVDLYSPDNEVAWQLPVEKSAWKLVANIERQVAGADDFAAQFLKR